MRKFSWIFAPCLGVLALFLTMASGAAAQCGAAPKLVTPALWHVSSAQAQFQLAADRHDDDSDGPSIVGLWHVNYNATYDQNFPPGNPATAPFLFTQTLKTWNADGTEIENAYLPPAGGNVCFGVWKNLGHGTVKLHHVGLMFDANGNVSATFNIDEIDTVARDGKTYTGTFDFKLFAPDNVFGVGAPISEIKGTTAATRFTVN